MTREEHVLNYKNAAITLLQGCPEGLSATVLYNKLGGMKVNQRTAVSELAMDRQIVRKVFPNGAVYALAEKAPFDGSTPLPHQSVAEEYYYSRG